MSKSDTAFATSSVLISLSAMFDAVKFGVSVVTEEEFDSLDQEKLQYNYSWIYDEKPKTEKEEKEVSEDLMEDMGKIVTLEEIGRAHV